MLCNLVSEKDSNTCWGRSGHILQMLHFLKSAVNIKYEKKNQSFKLYMHLIQLKKLDHSVPLVPSFSHLSPDLLSAH